MLVYKATSPSGKIYIGLTTQSLKRRIEQHFNTSKRENYKFNKALRKYGKQVTWEILEEAGSVEELKFLERYYIRYFDSYKNGYNGTLGGDGVEGIIFSKEVVAKIKKAAKKQWKNVPREKRQEINKHLLAYVGQNSIKVIDSMGNIFKSVTQAAKHYKVTFGSIDRCIKEKRKFRNTVCFKYYKTGDTSCPIWENTFKRKYACKKVIDQHGNYYKSAKEASIKLNINLYTIRSAIYSNHTLRDGTRLSYV